MFAATEPQEPSTHHRSRMRAVIADCDGARRDVLRRLVLSDRNYDLVGEAYGGAECSEIIARQCPELAICNGAYAPALQQPDYPFPLLITIASAPGAPSARVVCGLDLPLREAQVSEALALASSRILQAEVHTLSALMHAYLAHHATADLPLRQIEVEDETGQRIPLSADDVLWIKAAGNYVQLYTRSGSFELRDTISNMAHKLGTSGFTRIHRCVIVNERAVRDRKANDGRVSSVVLCDGTELLVGPNFRDQLPPDPGHFSFMATGD